jgi:hypothetical protein
MEALERRPDLGTATFSCLGTSVCEHGGELQSGLDDVGTNGLS